MDKTGLQVWAENSQELKSKRTRTITFEPAKHQTPKKAFLFGKKTMIDIQEYQTNEYNFFENRDNQLLLTQEKRKELVASLTDLSKGKRKIKKTTSFANLAKAETIGFDQKQLNQNRGSTLSGVGSFKNKLGSKTYNNFDVEKNSGKGFVKHPIEIEPLSILTGVGGSAKPKKDSMSLFEKDCEPVPQLEMIQDPKQIIRTLGSILKKQQRKIYNNTASIPIDLDKVYDVRDKLSRHIAPIRNEKNLNIFNFKGSSGSNEKNVAKFNETIPEVTELMQSENVLFDNNQSFSSDRVGIKASHSSNSNENMTANNNCQSNQNLQKPFSSLQPAYKLKKRKLSILMPNFQLHRNHIGTQSAYSKVPNKSMTNSPHIISNFGCESGKISIGASSPKVIAYRNISKTKTFNFETDHYVPFKPKKYNEAYNKKRPQMSEKSFFVKIENSPNQDKYQKKKIIKRKMQFELDNYFKKRPQSKKEKSINEVCELTLNYDELEQNEGVLGSTNDHKITSKKIMADEELRAVNQNKSANVSHSGNRHVNELKQYIWLQAQKDLSTNHYSTGESLYKIINNQSHDDGDNIGISQTATKYF